MNDITVLEEQENPQEETVLNDVEENQVETESVQETRENGLHQEENSVEPEKEETITEEQPDKEEQISESDQQTEPTKVASPKVQVSPVISW